MELKLMSSWDKCLDYNIAVTAGAHFKPICNKMSSRLFCLSVNQMDSGFTCTDVVQPFCPIVPELKVFYEGHDNDIHIFSEFQDTAT